MAKQLVNMNSYNLITDLENRIKATQNEFEKMGVNLSEAGSKQKDYLEGLIAEFFQHWDNLQAHNAKQSNDICHAIIKQLRREEII